MASDYTIVVKSERTAEVSSKLHLLLHGVVDEAIHNIESKAKVAAPVDTGFMRNSIGSEMTGELEGRAHVDAEYAPYVNFGTRHQAPRPFFTNAVESERPAFLARVEAVGRSLT